MATALDLWPVCFWGFWAYPFIGLAHYRRRRRLIELAAMCTSKPVGELTHRQALQVILEAQGWIRDGGGGSR